MNRIVAVIVPLCVVWLAGASLGGDDGTAEGGLVLADDPARPQGAAAVVIGEDASGKVVTVAEGGRFEIRLAGNPTTGFTWLAKPHEGAQIIRRSNTDDEAYVPDPVGEGIVGSGGMFVFAFDALTPGRVTLGFEYRQPWDAETPPARTFTVTVVVQTR